MPVKRRGGKARAVYPEAIAAVLSGQDLEFSEEAHQQLVGLVYFGDFPDAPPAALARAQAFLSAWGTSLSTTRSAVTAPLSLVGAIDGTSARTAPRHR